MMDKTMLHETVKSILLNEWDSIGINEFEEATDEYDAYVALICHMIAEGKSVFEFHRFLCSAIDAMGLDGDGQSEQVLAEKLAALVPARLS